MAYLSNFILLSLQFSQRHAATVFMQWTYALCQKNVYKKKRWNEVGLFKTIYCSLACYVRDKYSLF